MSYARRQDQAKPHPTRARPMHAAEVPFFPPGQSPIGPTAFASSANPATSAATNASQSARDFQAPPRTKPSTAAENEERERTEVSTVAVKFWDGVHTFLLL